VTFRSKKVNPVSQVLKNSKIIKKMQGGIGRDEKNDPRGLFSKAMNGREKLFVGVPGQNPALGKNIYFTRSVRGGVGFRGQECFGATRLLIRWGGSGPLQKGVITWVGRPSVKGELDLRGTPVYLYKVLFKAPDLRKSGGAKRKNKSN